MTENGDQLWKFNFNFMSLCRYFVVALSVAVAHSFITTLVSLSVMAKQVFPKRVLLLLAFCDVVMLGLVVQQPEHQALLRISD